MSIVELHTEKFTYTRNNRVPTGRDSIKWIEWPRPNAVMGDQWFEITTYEPAGLTDPRTYYINSTHVTMVVVTGSDDVKASEEAPGT